MNGNLSYQEEPKEELLNGRIVMMSGSSMNHSTTKNDRGYKKDL